MPGDLPKPVFGGAGMSYYWLSYQYYDSQEIEAAAPYWKEKVRKRDVRQGDEDGFVIALTSTADRPELRDFCEAHGVSISGV